MTTHRRVTLVRAPDGSSVALRRNPGDCAPDECGACQFALVAGGESHEDRWFRVHHRPSSVYCEMFGRADLGDVDEPSRCAACMAADITPEEPPLDGHAPDEQHDARYTRATDNSEREAWDEDRERARRGE